MRPIRLLGRLACAVLVVTVVACGGGSVSDDDDGEDPAAGLAEERIEAPPVATAPDGPAPRTTVDAAIEAARAAGEIDAEAALAARVLALAGDARLPARFRPAAIGRGDIDEVDGNAVIAELRAAWPALSAPTQRLLAPFMRRPTSAAGWSPDAAVTTGTTGREAAAAVRPTCATGAGWARLDAAVARVRVWYEPSSAGDLAQAQAVVAAFDTAVWPTLVTTLGFNAPLSDLALDCDGGNARLDVYIVAGFGSLGATYPESTSPRRSSTFIVVRSGLAGGVLQHTVTHQFMHAVMWSYLMAAGQESYGWMRNALANWAVEAVYPGNATLLADASCHMNSTFLPITNLATGACSASISRSRDYGAYLLYQYIGRTAGNATVRDLVAATTTQTTALGAIEAVMPGGLRALWPRYAKTLWNQLPVTAAGRPAYFNWDGLATVPALAPDRPTPVNANLGGAAEASTSLSRSVANVSTRFYRFTFSDVATRSLMFRNTFYPLFRAGSKVSVQALWRPAGGAWVEEDWTRKEWIGFCRDAKAQRLAELVVIVASGEVGGVTQVVATNSSTFRRNNIGCWGFRGSARRTDVYGSWSAGTITANSTLLFDYKPNGLATTQYNDPATGRLRVPIAAPLFRRVAWALDEAYAQNDCSYQLTASATDTTVVLGGLAFSTLIINNFAESLPASLRVQQQGVVGSARGAYSINAGSQRFGLLGSVSGPQPACGTQYESAVGFFTLTNVSPATAPVIALDGHLRGSYVASSSPDSVVFTWDLAPLREP
jgi:hypothetical protein